MNMDLSILSLARELGSHATARQAVIAQNVANADTPGYKAQDISSFAEAFDAGGPGALSMRTTRPGHIADSGGGAQFSIIEDTAFAAESPNGNTVSVEDQMMRAVEAQQSHELALGVYRKSMDILRMTMGRR